jgi:hypothetical protein
VIAASSDQLRAQGPVDAVFDASAADLGVALSQPTPDRAPGGDTAAARPTAAVPPGPTWRPGL